MYKEIKVTLLLVQVIVCDCEGSKFDKIKSIINDSEENDDILKSGLFERLPIEKSAMERQAEAYDEVYFNRDRIDEYLS